MIGESNYIGHTLPETNIFAPESGWLEDEFPFGILLFSELLLLVSRSVGHKSNHFKSDLHKKDTFEWNPPQKNIKINTLFF